MSSDPPNDLALVAQRIEQLLAVAFPAGGPLDPTDSVMVAALAIVTARVIAAHVHGDGDRAHAILKSTYGIMQQTVAAEILHS